QSSSFLETCLTAERKQHTNHRGYDILIKSRRLEEQSGHQHQVQHQCALIVSSQNKIGQNDTILPNHLQKLERNYVSTESPQNQNQNPTWRSSIQFLCSTNLEQASRKL
ncbi:hypothetical protein ATANTOWER_029710, partial [Ataeniobius toweri]|nr:hypothetical protein [Ataeniobius toweri]